MMPTLNRITYSQDHVSPQHHLPTLTVWPVTVENGNTHTSSGCQWPVVGK